MKKNWHDQTIKPSDITPETLYKRRREFLKLGAVAIGTALLTACGLVKSGESTNNIDSRDVPTPVISTTKSVDELGDSLSSYENISGFNNYYEFTTNKELIAKVASRFKSTPWQIEVGGLVRNPRVFGLEDILKVYPRQERIYRLRCVEGWSMVIPWLGFPLASLLKDVEPTGNARYVRFTSVLRPEEMPGQNDPSYPWPYEEGLRLDEAMNDLTILSTGLYGTELLNQNGAPIRLVVPWKYGFKSIKSIVKIELVEDQPSTLWSMVGPNEYGFYSNVNPNKSHPRWSQESERRIGDLGRRKTKMFNGYEEQVASMYAGMDLNVNY